MAWRIFGSGLGREIVSFLRVPRLRVGAIVTALVALVALGISSPGLMALAFVGYIGFASNLLGADVPLDGIERYAIAGIPLDRVFRNRRTMVAMTAALPALLALLITAAFARSDDLRPASTRVVHIAVAFVYGWSAYLMLTLWGERESQRVQRPITRARWPDREDAGSFAESMRAFGAIVAVTLVCIAIYAACARIPLGTTTDGTAIAPMAIAAACQLAGVAFLRTFRHRGRVIA
jgi:hypothetical protein